MLNYQRVYYIILCKYGAMTQISSQLSNPLREASDTMCTQRPLFSTTADELKLQAWYNKALWYEPKSCGMNPLWYENVTASHCQITTARKLQMIIFLKHVETDRLFKDPRVKEKNGDDAAMGQIGASEHEQHWAGIDWN